MNWNLFVQIYRIVEFVWEDAFNEMKAEAEKKKQARRDALKKPTPAPKKKAAKKRKK